MNCLRKQGGGVMAPVASPEELLAAPRVDPDGTTSFRPSHSFYVPTVPGVYLIHDLRGSLYVGRSDNIGKRFQQHHEFSHNSRLRLALRAPVGPISFSWLLAEGLEQKALEARLIRYLDPLCNDIRYVTTKENS